MNDLDRSKEELVAELEALRQRLAEQQQSVPFEPEGALLQAALLSIATPQPRDSLERTIIEWTTRLLHAREGLLYLLDSPDKPRLAASWPSAIDEATERLVRGRVREASEQGQSRLSQAPDTHLLTLPIALDWQRIGGLGFLSQSPFTLADQAQGELLARHVAAALEHLRQRDEIAHRMAQVSGLYRIALATGSVLEQGVLLERFYQEIYRLLEPDSFVVSLYDGALQEVEVALVMEGGESVPSVMGTRLPVADAGLTGWVISHQRTLNVRDALVEPLPCPPRPYASRPIRSWLGVPLLRGRQIIGSFSVQAYQPGAFNDADQRFLEAMAAQVAIALTSAQLFREEQQQADELETVWQATLTLSSSLNSKAVLDTVLQAALKLLDGVQDAHIFLYREERLLFGAALWSDAKRQMHLEPRQDGLTYTVARRGEIVAVPDMRDHDLYQDAPDDWPIGSIIGLPLKIGERVVGVMNVAFAMPRTIPEREQRLLRRLADQAALAIENSRLFEAAEQRAAELEAVRQASLSLTSSLELQEVLDAILDATMRLLAGAWGANIFMYEAGQLTFGAALCDGERVNQAWSEPRPEGLTYTVARTGEPFVIPNMASHPLYADQQSDSKKGAIVSLPLKYGERVVGVMNISYHEPRSFTESELHRVRLVGDQAAIAIEKARLHGLVTREARTDALTTLPNRRALDERLAEEVRRATRYQHRFALVMMDLNGFKHVNDTYGHPMGDAVLQQVARNLSAACRDTDFLARYGGDEFALLLPETDMLNAQKVIRKLERTVTAGFAPLLSQFQADALSLSVGLAIFPEEATNATSLVELADRALYLAKKKHHQASLRGE